MPRFALALLLLSFLACGTALAQADDAAELERTWQEAWVFLPDEGPLGYRELSVRELPQALAEAKTPLPAVVYAHGCAGHWQASTATGAFLAKAGFLVVMPDGFARENKPVSCIPTKRQGGLHRAVLAWRQAEVAKAIEEVGGLPGVREDAIFLMGHSEGGITTATFEGPPLAGRVVEGWTCHAGWPEYRGLKGPPDEPLLTLVAADDPWFRLPILAGDCGAYMQDRTQARSLVVREPANLAASHWLTKDKAIQAEVLDFLKGNLPD